MTASNDAFKKVETDSFVQTLCSPQPPDDPDFRGILINAPREVEFRQDVKVGPFGAFAFIPICGFFRLGVESMPPSANDFCEAMRLVARHHETNLKFTGPLVESPQRTVSQSPSAAAEPPQEADLPPGFAVGGYFNSNMAQFLSLPQISATYDIHVELGDRDADHFVISNTVTVTIKEVSDHD